MSTFDLFGHAPEKPARKRRAKGHARPPGTGPAGEKCKSCAHYTIRRYAKTYRKCGLMEAHWTRGASTDIRANDPACELWKGSQI